MLILDYFWKWSRYNKKINAGRLSRIRVVKLCSSSIIMMCDNFKHQPLHCWSNRCSVPFTPWRHCLLILFLSLALKLRLGQVAMVQTPEQDCVPLAFPIVDSSLSLSICSVFFIHTITKRIALNFVWDLACSGWYDNTSAGDIFHHIQQFKVLLVSLPSFMLYSTIEMGRGKKKGKVLCPMVSQSIIQSNNDWNDTMTHQTFHSIIYKNAYLFRLPVTQIVLEQSHGLFYSETKWKMGCSIMHPLHSWLRWYHGTLIYL